MLGLERQISDLNSRLSNLFRVGTVTSIDEGAVTARVVFNDRDNMESFDLQVIVKNTLQNQDYWMPDIDEQVLCLFLPIGLEQGFIIGSYYIDTNAAPAITGNKRTIKFKDGTVIEYDREQHRLVADLGESKINVSKQAILLESNGKSITIDGSGITIDGPVTQTGGDMTSDGISAQNHTHGGVTAGSASTDVPQ